MMKNEVSKFIKENSKSPVVSGRLKDDRSVVYKLKNGKVFTLPPGELHKAGFLPIWDL